MRINVKKLNWGALAAILAIVLVFAYDSLAPKQATAPRAAKSLAQLQKELDEKKAAAQAASAVVDGQTWQVARDQVGPKAMDWVSRQAQANFVQVSAFRPQRTADADGLDQLNYLLTAEGPFLNVMKFLSAFESPESLLAVKVVQISSADGSTDTVRATIGLVTYQKSAGQGAKSGS